MDNTKSLVWTRKYFEPGTFDIIVPLTDKNVTLFQKQRIVAKQETEEAGVIEDLKMLEGLDEKYIQVKGRFISSYTDRRLVQKTFTFSGKVEDAMHDLVDYVTPIPLLVNTAAAGYTETVSFQATMKNLQIYLTKLSKQGQIGYRIRPNFKEKNYTLKHTKAATEP